MNLQEFVGETLRQIIAGVKDAQTSATEKGAQINPEPTSTKQATSMKGGVIHTVQFDVALTVADKTESKGGIGIFAGAVALGSSGKSNSQNSSVSRVQFSVPITLPSAD